YGQRSATGRRRLAALGPAVGGLLPQVERAVGEAFPGQFLAQLGQGGVQRLAPGLGTAGELDRDRTVPDLGDHASRSEVGRVPGAVTGSAGWPACAGRAGSVGSSVFVGVPDGIGVVAAGSATAGAAAGTGRETGSVARGGPVAGAVPRVGPAAGAGPTSGAGP